ncbi:MAG: hypothetical protein ACLRR6_00175 [Oscillospiraceae bacterium]
MKDIPVFSCPDGIATLILREVPFRGEGYILVRGVFGTLEGLLAECAGFCRAAGAERLFAAGEADFSGYPAAIRILGRSAPRASLLPAPEAVRLVPVTEETAADWARNTMRASGPCPQRRAAARRRSARWPRAARPCGSGTVQSASALAACAAVSGWQWQLCSRARANAACGRWRPGAQGLKWRLTCAAENTRAMRLYDRLGFSAARRSACGFPFDTRI